MQSNCQIGLGVHPHTHEGHEHGADRAGTLDLLGIGASVLCMVHCMAMPLLIGILPALGLTFLEGHLAHQVLAFFVVAFALAAVLPAYLKHRRNVVLLSMIVGIGLVLIATFGSGRVFPEAYELPFITAGNLLVVVTHWRNRHLITTV